MADLTLQLDLSELERFVKDMDSLDGELQKAVEALTFQTHAHITEQAQQKLKSRREKFLENLKVEKVSDYTWAITVMEPAVWIETGMPAHSMVQDLLSQSPHNPNSKPPKISKTGEKYRVIPFKHDKGPTQQTPAQRSLTATLKNEMKERKIPYVKIERDEHGRPKTGLLHAFDIRDRPVKSGSYKGQGHGPQGQVMQGNTGIPFLQGVRVYQNLVLNKDGTPKTNKKGEQQAVRSIMTFRIVKESHEGNKWQHPGLEGAHFLDEALDWAQTTWENDIVPDILKRFDR